MVSVWCRVRTLACALGALLPAALPAQTIVSGFVKDSLTGRPLTGATIQLVPSDKPWLAGRITRSDSLGRFRIDTVAPGQYLFGFEHPRLDSLGLDGVTTTLFVDKAIRVLRADLAVPSGRSFVTTLCGPRADSTGAVIGRVFNAETNEPIASGSVIVRYAQMRIDGGGVRRVPVQVPAPFGADGRYVACGIPTDVAVLVQARAGAGDAATRLGTSGEVELNFTPKVPLLHRDLLVSLRATDTVVGAGGVAPTRPSSAPARTGTARLTGRVVAGDGSPVVGARVSVQDTDISTLADSNGTFRVSGLPSGSRTIEVVAIGYTPVRSSADLRPNREAAITVNIGAKVSTLAGVKVTAPADRSGFAARRATGNGFFIDASALQTRGSQTVASVLTTAPSLRANGFSTVDPTRPRVSGRNNCTPNLFLDGMQMRDGTDGLDDLVQVGRVGGIEVYSNPAQAPAQYRGSGSCATILVWTRAYVP